MRPKPLPHTTTSWGPGLVAPHCRDVPGLWGDQPGVAERLHAAVAYRERIMFSGSLIKGPATTRRPEPLRPGARAGAPLDDVDPRRWLDAAVVECFRCGWVCGWRYVRAARCECGGCGLPLWPPGVLEAALVAFELHGSTLAFQRMLVYPPEDLR